MLAYLKKSTMKFLRRITRKYLYNWVYQFHALWPVKKNKIVFMEPRYHKLSENYTKLIEVLERDYNVDIHCHFLELGSIPRREDIHRQFKYMRDTATAAFLIFDDSTDTQGAFKLRKETRTMNTWHGAGAFKMFGFSTADKIFGRSRESMLEYKIHCKYDLFTVSSPEVEWAFRDAIEYGFDQHVKGIGLSRTDVFYDEEYIKGARKEVEKLFPQAANKKILLYAPTFRGRVNTATTPDEIDIDLLFKKLSSEYVLLIKHHPLVKASKRPVIDEKYKDFAIDLSDNIEMSKLLCVADICITDYSSLVFEYSIFERPMIFFAYDLDEYNDWRGFYYDYDEMTPGPKLFNTEEIVDYIENVDERFDKEAVHKFREKFMSGCDGHATERIMKEFFGDRLEAYRK